MSYEISPAACPDLTPSTSEGRVRSYLENARARNTIKGYRSSFRQFERWCQSAGLVSMPAMAETVALYLGAQAGRLKPATLEHHLAAITKAHKSFGAPSPVEDSMLIRETLKGIKRVHGTAAKQKSPVLTEDLRVMLRSLSPDIKGCRDRALLLLGFAGAFRRSELVGLDVSDLKIESQGLLVTIRTSPLKSCNLVAGSG